MDKIRWYTVFIKGVLILNQFFYYFGIAMSVMVGLLAIIWVGIARDSIAAYIKRFFMNMVQIFVPLVVVLSLTYGVIDYFFNDGSNVIYELIGILITVIFVDFFQAERNRKEEKPLRTLAETEMDQVLKKLEFIIENTFVVSSCENYSEKIYEALRNKSWIKSKILLNALDEKGKFKRTEVHRINLLFEKGFELREALDRVLKVYGSVLIPDDLNFIGKLSLELSRRISQQNLLLLLQTEDDSNDLETKYQGIELVFNNLSNLYMERKGAKDDKRFLQRLYFTKKLQRIFKRK